MEEQLIKFKTAKLAKEKGLAQKLFNTSWYNELGRRNGRSDINLEGKTFNTTYSESSNPESLKKSDFKIKIYLAPTQSLLSTWLKKTHGLYAYIDWVDDEVVIVDFKNSEGEELFRANCYDFVPDYESEEELLEELLQKALKLIK
ncbi:MAG: hypothetical protein ACJAVA_000174 [Flavobacteriaceae bacterium]|jgi:hypothetical protein